MLVDAEETLVDCLLLSARHRHLRWPVFGSMCLKLMMLARLLSRFELKLHKVGREQTIRVITVFTVFR